MPTITQNAIVLFKPSDAIALVQGGDNGTPWQKDEPQAENAPVGAMIDYYLKTAAGGPLTIEIRDASGKVIRGVLERDDAATGRTAANRVGAVARVCRQPCPPRPACIAGFGTLRETPPAGGGGGGGGGFRQQQPMRTGSFTVKLSVNGQTLTQPLVVQSGSEAEVTRCGEGAGRCGCGEVRVRGGAEGGEVRRAGRC